jgi:hypothetical protein
MSAHSTSEIFPTPELLEITRAGVEIWRPIISTNGTYEVSNLGGARSWAVTGWAGRRADTPTALACSPQTTGYRTIQICSNGKRRCVLLHVCILEAFIGPRPGPHTIWQGGHHDDDRLNNLLTNLKWCTQSVNQKDIFRNGRGVNRERASQEIDGVRHYRCTGCDAWKAGTEFSPLSASLVEKSRCKIASQCRRCTATKDAEAKRAKRAARGAKPRKRRLASI